MLRRIVVAAVATAAVAVSLAPGASAAPSTAESVTTAWYAEDEFLSRDAADAAADPGRQYWVRIMNTGTQGSDALRAITSTAEYNARMVDDFYEDHLKNSPGARDGRQYWVSMMNSGRMAEEHVEQAVIASPEFRAEVFQGPPPPGLPPESGSTPAVVVSDADAVTAYFNALLGRKDRAGGESDYWQSRLRSVGTERTVRELAQTAEAERLFVTRLCVGLLEREPADVSAGELDYWQPRAEESHRDVKVLIGASAEYVRDN